jgi:hypothetical protein
LTALVSASAMRKYELASRPSDRRSLTTVVRRPNGGVSINQGHAYVNLSAEELQRLQDFTRASTPAAVTPAKAAARLGVLQRDAIAPVQADATNRPRQ